MNGFSDSQIRQLEADLKRKSDLLSEVKVLLKSAADRERRQLAESDELKRKLRLVRPETPPPRDASAEREIHISLSLPDS